MLKMSFRLKGTKEKAKKKKNFKGIKVIIYDLRLKLRERRLRDNRLDKFLGDED